MKKIEKRKILGIDYGDFYIGLAIFDASVDFIYPYKTIKRDRENVLRKSIREIENIVKKENITAIVLGLPVNMDGTSGDRVKKVNIFMKMLKNKMPNIEITLQDERLTTKEAKEILKGKGIKESDMKEMLDQVAAEIILKDYKGGDTLAKKKVENIITLQGEDGDVQVEVIEQTVIDGTTYLLVADVTDDEEDSDCYILKDVSEENSEEANYEVLDDSESEIVFETFEKMLSHDIDLKK